MAETRNVLLLAAVMLLAPHLYPGVAAILALVCFFVALLLDWKGS